MLLIKENIDIWYREYARQFEKSVKYIKSRKGSTRGLKPLSRRDFQYDFISQTYDNPNLSGAQIARKMAKQEVFPQSWKQAEKHAEAHVAKFGGKVDIGLITKYRIQSEDRIFELQEERRVELKQKGFSSNEIALLISQEFYGSE